MSVQFSPSPAEGNTHKPRQKGVEAQGVRGGQGGDERWDRGSLQPRDWLGAELAESF